MSLVHRVEDLFKDKKYPERWQITTLNTVATIQNGYAFKSKLFNSTEGFPLLRIRDILESKIETYYSGDFSEEYIVNADDLIIGMDGDFNHALWKNKLTLLNQRVCRIKPNESFILKKFIFYGIGEFLKIINENTSSTTVKHLSSKSINEIPFPLPPLPEQERIVAKLDALFAQHEAMKKALECIPELLKDFRQQILAQAVLNNYGYTKLKDFLIDIKYGTSKKSDYDIDGIPVLRIPNIDNGRINSKDLKYSILDKKESDILSLKTNDILIIRSNGSINLVGQSAIVSKDFENYSYAGYLIRIRLSDKYNPVYLNYIFKSNFIRSQMIDTSRSTSGVNNINSKEIQELNVPLIPLKKQKEIVSRIESLFAQADIIEKRYKILKEKIDNLPQAILHKAFKGELVPQLPTDGDAKDLLEEIKKLKKEVKKK
jgi:type I restriction enzyme S subunit